MFIKKITIKNFRLFENFELNSFNIPDGQNEWSSLNLFVGENGCGKISLLDAIALPLLSYKAESFSVDDFFDLKNRLEIELFSDIEFDFKGIMPKTNYKGQGFLFEAGIKKRENKNYLSSIVVFDTKFIIANNQKKPNNNNNPDLRVNVNNSWSGTRFSENDVLFLDKNRTYQTRSGTYNQTRFDGLMEDFDYQYLSQENRPIDFSEKLQETLDGVSSEFLTN